MSGRDTRAWREEGEGEGGGQVAEDPLVSEEGSGSFMGLGVGVD